MKFFLYCIFGFLLITSPPTLFGQTSELERNALISIYESTNGDQWNERGGWKESSGEYGAPGSECSWFGVTCNQGLTRRVLRLRLPQNGLSGSLSPAIGELRNLQELDLSDNQIGGLIPAELRQVRTLRRINLRNNTLIGPIPLFLAELSQLRSLVLRGNRLEGSIPPELSTLSRLRVLSLSENQLEGLIPPQLSQLSQLESLSLWANRLEGPIPAELGDLSRLQFLFLRRNMLTGIIPSELGKLSQLRELLLDNNRLTGPIPADLGRLSELEELELQDNQLSGPLPPELGGLGNLDELNLQDNKLSGEIPVEFSNLARLQFLLVGGNNLSGTLPGFLGELSRLEILSLYDNHLKGDIPESLKNLTDLTVLELYKNRLTGSIPVELASLPGLTVLNLSDNWLTGPLHQELGLLSKLESLNLSNNQLTGNIPESIGSLGELVELDLADNLLSGILSLELTALDQLQFLNLAENQLQTESEELLAFLDSVQVGGSFRESQRRLFYLPYLQGGETSFTGVAVTNFSEEPALIRWTAYPTSQGTGGVKRSPTRSLAGGHQVAALGSDLFNLSPADPLSSWVELTSLSGEVDGEPVPANFDLAGFFQFGSPSLTRLDGAKLLDRPSTHLILTRIFEGTTAFRGQPATTRVTITNPTRAPAKVRLTLRGGSVSPLSMRLRLGPRESVSQSLSEYFGLPLEVSRGYLAIETLEGAGVIAFNFIQLNGEETVIGLNGIPDHSSRSLFSAQLAQDEQLFTEINFINRTDTTLHVSVGAVDEMGRQAAPARELAIGPGEQHSADAGELFPQLPLTFVGSLVAEVDGEGLLGDVLFGDVQNQRFAGALPLQTEAFHEAVFPHVANLPGFFTGLAFFHPAGDEAVPAQLEVSVFRPDGTFVGEAFLELAPGERTSQLVDELVEASAGQAGGYVRIRSDRPLIAQMLFGATDEGGISLLSAVLPIVVE